MKAIQIGTGNFGRSWRKSFEAPDMEMAALVDFNPTFLEEARQHFGLNTTDCCSPNDPWEQIEADLVIDASPHAFHLANARRAMAYGKHYICVKPMCSTWEDGEALVELSRETGCKAAVSQQLRYNPRILKLREIVMSGAIGKIGYVHLDTPAEKEGLLGNLHSTYGDRYPALVGGSIHTLDYARWVTGADAVTVYAESFNPHWIEREEQYCGYAIYQMSEGFKLVYRLIASEDKSPDRWISDWHIEGDKGRLTLDRGVMRLNGEVVEVPAGTEDLPTLNARVLRELTNWIEGGPEPLTSVGNNLNSMAMLFGFIKSSETGARINLRTM